MAAQRCTGKMHPPCPHHQVGPGQEGQQTHHFLQGDTTGAPLPGLRCGTGPASPFPLEKRSSPKIRLRKPQHLPESVQSLKPQPGRCEPQNLPSKNLSPEDARCLASSSLL